MKNLVISNHPTTGQIAGIASCMEKITMYQFHSDRACSKIQAASALPLTSSAMITNSRLKRWQYIQQQRDFLLDQQLFKLNFMALDIHNEIGTDETMSK